jgi:hypothetical protein
VYNSEISIDEINCRDELGIVHDREEHIANHSIDLTLEHRTKTGAHYARCISSILEELTLKIKSIMNRLFKKSNIFDGRFNANDNNIENARMHKDTERN